MYDAMKYAYGTEDSNCPTPCEHAEVSVWLKYETRKYVRAYAQHQVGAAQHFVLFS